MRRFKSKMQTQCKYIKGDEALLRQHQSFTTAPSFQLSIRVPKPRTRTLGQGLGHSHSRSRPRSIPLPPGATTNPYFPGLARPQQPLSAPLSPFSPPRLHPVIFASACTVPKFQSWHSQNTVAKGAFGLFLHKFTALSLITIPRRVFRKA